jgi:formylglycine-generating enzyme required for sulfatase activity
MLVTRENLSQCPRCDSALEPSASQCSNCEYKEIENVDFLDVSDQREYRERLRFQRASWVQFDTALRNKLKEVRWEWRKLANWNQLWNDIEPMAKAVEFDEQATNARAEKVSTEIISAEIPDPPKPSPHLEAVRNWVAGLSDGEVDTVVWRKFLETLGNPENDSFLKNFRDAEISRQFAQFETARVDAQGKLQLGAVKRVRRFVENLGNGCDLVMVLIPDGGFQMGSDRYRWERPIHAVNVPSFYLGQFPVTQAQWRAVVRLPKVTIGLGEHCSAFEGDNLPVESVSWAEATEFCARLAQETGKPYRLATEAEWEYACRAGNSEDFSFGPTITPVIVNYDGTQTDGGVSMGRTVPVGSLGPANDFGVYDMHGNVCEWCKDEWHENYEGAPRNGSAWTADESSAPRVTRGGSWTHSAEICRSSDRSREASDLNTRLHYMGFRVATTF